MPSILVVEQEPRYIERIEEALLAEGWKVRVVAGQAEALQQAASEAPDLVVVGARTAGAEAVASSFSRSAGGPGVIALLPEDASAAGTGGLEADELVAMPFTAQELRLVARRLLAARREAPAPAQPASTQAGPDEPKLTSRDIFGDMLAEVESAVAHAAPPPPGRPAAASQAGAPAAPAAHGDEEIRRKLEQTLSGVLGTASPGKPRPPASPPTAAGRPGAAPRRPDLSAADVDALISKTLSGLGAPARPAARPAASPPGPAPAAAPPAPGASSPTASAPSPTASAPSPAAGAPEGTGVRRDRTGSFDFSELEELARTGSRPAASPRPAAPAPARPASPPAGPSAAPAVPPVARPATPPIAAVPPAPARAATPAPPPAMAPAEGPPSAAAPPPAAPRPAAPPPAAAGSTAPPAGARPASPTSVPRPAWTGPPPAAASPAPPPSPAPPLPPSGASVRSGPDLSTRQVPIFTEGQQEGDRFGQYTLLERVAVGGMAEVWKARMRGVEGFQKTVAIKKILPHLTDNSEFLGMFIDEAKLAAQLSHPNIVHIYDLGKIGRDYYIAMEFVEGKDLRSLGNAARSRGLALPHGLALLIAARLASALEYAHRKRDFEGHEMGLVHRDVSPQNVLITPEGDIKLCDFGIAKAVSKASQTQMGALKGKLQYMSPEQAWGRTVDARSDIFSLGSILFELLTGERLFAGDSEMSVLEAVRDGRVRSPRSIDPTISPEVEAIVAKALAREPERRYANAGEMQARLEAALYAEKPAPSPGDLATWLERVLGPEAPAAAPPAVPPTPPPSALAPYEEEEPAPAPALPEEPTELEPAAEPAPGEIVEAIAPLGAAVPVEESEPRGRLLLWAAILLLAILGAVGYFYFGRGKSPSANPPVPAPARTAQAPAEVPAAVPPAGTEAAGPAPATAPGPDVAGIMNEELARRELALKQKYEQEEKRLQQELTKQQATKAAAPAPAGATPAPAAPEPAPPAVPPPAEPQERAPEPAPARAEPAAEPEPPRQEPAPEPEPAAAAPAPKAKRGDLVPTGPGATPPALVSHPQPGYPPQARKMRIEGTVVVGVLVDENGRVIEAKVLEPIKRDFGLNAAALDVARSARYRPASKDGVPVKMWVRLKVPFNL